MRPAEFYLIISFILENKSVRITHSSKLDGGRGSFPWKRWWSCFWMKKNSHIVATGQWYAPSAVNYSAISCTILHYLALSCTILHYLALMSCCPHKVFMSQQISQVIALDIAVRVVAQKVKVQYWGPVWSEKVGWWGGWTSSRSGWLLELLTELKSHPI